MLNTTISHIYIRLLKTNFFNTSLQSVDENVNYCIFLAAGEENIDKLVPAEPLMVIALLHETKFNELDLGARRRGRFDLSNLISLSVYLTA